MGIIYCIGENLEAREAEKTLEVLGSQLSTLAEALQGVWSDVIIAYEPLWAYGTGKISSADQT